MAASYEKVHTSLLDDTLSISDEDDDSIVEKGGAGDEADNLRHIESLAFSLNIRMLAGFILFVLLLPCQIILYRQCIVASTKQSLYPEESVVRKYKVATKHKSIELISKPEGHKTKGLMEPGQVVEIYSQFQNEDYYRILEPYLGFGAKFSPQTGRPYFEPLDEYVRDSYMCPLLYEGWKPEDEKESRYVYAPISLVISQQLWNACQVLTLFLVIALNYECSQQATKRMTPTFYWRRKWAVKALFFVTICLLPFAVYVISPGGHVFALVSFMTIMISFFTPVSALLISIGEQNEEVQENDSVSSRSYWTLTREETLGCLCNLGSSVYNYVGGISTFPYWKKGFQHIDKYFGWRTGSVDVLVENDWTLLGLFSNSRLPLFVPRGSGGTTFGGQVFLIVWSVLPFLYVSYFLCMMVLSCKSPGKWIQRLLCGFGICHFLFFTDFVDYRYGRGYRNPHQEVFHWTEKWSWRIAILLPIYQNCTNGHWSETSHKKFPFLGRWLRRLMMLWFVWFFLFQTIQSDIPQTYQFAMGLKQKKLIPMLGFSHKPFLKSWIYPYWMATVMMWSFYGLLHITGFTLFKINVQRKNGKNASNNNTAIEMRGLISRAK